MRASILAVVALVGCKGPVEPDVAPPPSRPPPDAQRVVVEPPKLVTYRRFLAGVDATLHSVRLGTYRKWESYLTWVWPTWMPREALDARLDELLVLAAGAPPTTADASVRAYVETVRAILPVWDRAFAAWQEGADAYLANYPSLIPTYERLGEASAAWRHAMPREPEAPAGSVEAAAQACYVGAEIAARIDRAVPVEEITAEAPRTAAPTIYVAEPAGNLRAAGLRCARLGLDVLERAQADDEAAANRMISMGLTLVTEESRRTNLHGAYVTGFGNYAQTAYYATE